MTSSIFIANLAEIAKPLARFMGKKQREFEIYEDHALCDRFLFTNSDNRLLITPFPLDKEFVSDAKKLLNYKNFHVESPFEVSDSVCESILKDKRLLQTLMKTIRENPSISLISYAATDEFIILVDWLKEQGLHFNTPELPSTDYRWTSHFFDSKGGFRQAMNELTTPTSLPDGFICQTKDQIIGFAEFFLKQGRGCVLKTNKGLAGAGLRIIRKEDVKTRDIRSYVKKIFYSEPYWKSDLVVVEEFHEPNLNVCGGAPSVEFVVAEDHIKPLYGCGMRITKEGIFKGVEVGKNAVSKNINKAIFQTGRTWAGFLQQIGYRGFFDIDFVFNKKGQLFPIESNLRRTGGTHVYELGLRLFGEQFQEHYYLAANNIAKASRLKEKTYHYIKKTLFPILYPIHGTSEGIILTDITYASHGNIGYVAVGKNEKSVAQIEEKLLNLI